MASSDIRKVHRHFYIGGQWVPSHGEKLGDVINPATEEVSAQVALGNVEDVNHAVQAAVDASAFGFTSKAERLELLRRVLQIYERRYEEFVNILPIEMGAPITWARSAQALLGIAHLKETINALERMELEERRGTMLLARVPIGVAALITPWNWPINQVVTKVAGALAAGCTMVLKPSELTPLDAILFAEVLHEAGVPPGVFNLINGTGATVGYALCSHPDVQAVSFTGSTATGIAITQAAAPTVKRVHQELGGKSADIILDDMDLQEAVCKGVARCFSNTGQSCSIPTRMLLPANKVDEAKEIARAFAATYIVGDPLDEATMMGPQSNRAQFEKVQLMIAEGISEGASVVTGGLGRPAGLKRGYFTRPTVFAGVRPDMTIAQQEIFGPVLSMLAYSDEEEAIKIANGTVYGLGGAVQSKDLERARRVARRIHSGHVYINHDLSTYAAAPFGGFKQSGNGIGHAEWGIDAFLETKAILGYYPH